MTWNYRILKSISESEVSYAIHEVYYDEQGQISGWTESPMNAFGESLSELRNDLLWFWSAFRKPVLIESVDGDGNPVLSEDPEDKIVVPGHELEVMDRAAVAQAHFDDFVAGHPVIRRDPELGKRAQQITDLMYDLYSELAHRAMPVE